MNRIILNKLKLEEEQAILDTIKDIGKKRDRSPNLDRSGNIDMSNPFGEVSAPISTTPSFEGNEGEEISEEVDERERINNEESGEGM